MAEHPKPSFSQRRRVENEVMFKQENERIKQVAESVTVRTSALPIPFYCECANLNCSKIINLTSEDFEAFHDDPDWYTILPGHEQLDIEKVIKNNDGFLVIKKLESVTP